MEIYNFIIMFKYLSFEHLKPYSGLVIALIGGVFLLAAIFDADWLFNSDPKSFNIKKIAGQVNLRGRKFTRFSVGLSALLGIITGLIWFWYDMTHS